MIRLCIRYRGVSSGHRVCDCWPARTAEIGQKRSLALILQDQVLAMNISYMGLI